MGGIGSGATTNRPTTSALPALDVRKLYREGRLQPTATRCTVQSKEGPAHPVEIVWTPCNYGGARPWFLCPRCLTRRAVLYIHHNRAACRACWRMAYPSQREDVPGRMYRRAEKLRERAVEPEGSERAGRKRKGLHWRTYDRLCDGIEEADRISLHRIARALRMPGL